jgi:hypothetical protein
MESARWLLLMVFALLLLGCGAQRTATSAPPDAAPTTTPATPPAATPPAEQTCPVCGHKVPAEAKYCRMCGSRLK